MGVPLASVLHITRELCDKRVDYFEGVVMLLDNTAIGATSMDDGNFGHDRPEKEDTGGATFQGAESSRHD